MVWVNIRTHRAISSSRPMSDVPGVGKVGLGRAPYVLSVPSDAAARKMVVSRSDKEKARASKSTVSRWGIG